MAQLNHGPQLVSKSKGLPDNRISTVSLFHIKILFLKDTGGVRIRISYNYSFALSTLLMYKLHENDTVPLPPPPNYDY